MDYAKRYIAKGFKTASLDGIFTTHIGRRTYERETDKLNSYDLNNEQQFGEKPKTEKTYYVDTVVINMKRRTDRLLKFFRNNNNFLPGFRVFQAVDGKALQGSQKIQRLFGNGDYNFRRGIVGCAYSHIKLWKELVADFGKDYMIVLEDDVRVTENFYPKVMNMIRFCRDFDVLFLHWNPYIHLKSQTQSEYDTTRNPVAVEWNKEKSFACNMGSTAGYVITRQGAYNLLSQLDKHGCVNAIDWEMMKCVTNRTFYSSPMAVFADCVQNGAIDTDIQKDYSTVGLSVEESIEQEQKYWGKIKEIDYLPNVFDEVLMLPRSCEELVTKLVKSEPFQWYLTGTRKEDKIVLVPWVKTKENLVTEKTLGNHLLNEFEP
jgi:GR25 family glycosyltransferase involved in LPS biosynthesis